nr:terminase small subunit [Cereibacter sphaeroides f. sp. denitrificans]
MGIVRLQGPTSCRFRQSGSHCEPQAGGRIVGRTSLTARQEAFVREYLIDLNATQAAIRAGYSAKTAEAIGSENLRKPLIAAAIAEAQAARFERLELDADALLARAATILQADPRELTAHHVGACRYCWGVDHEYQWKTLREWREECDKAEEAGKPLPSDAGGFGYRLTEKPNPACPECAGLGIPYTRFADTRDLSAAAALLFEGVKETRNGIEFIMASKEKAFDVLAKHKGLLKEKVEHDVTDGLAKLIAGAQGTPLPIKRQTDQ